jgi:hypothetical protein
MLELRSMLGLPAPIDQVIMLLFSCLPNAVRLPTQCLQPVRDHAAGPGRRAGPQAGLLVNYDRVQHGTWTSVALAH